VVGSETEDFQQMLTGFRRAALTQQELGEVEMCFRISGIECEGPPVGGFGV
jgi:hypothetical protein